MLPIIKMETLKILLISVSITLLSMSQPSCQLEWQFHHSNARRNVIILKRLLLKRVRNGMNIFLLREKKRSILANNGKP